MNDDKKCILVLEDEKPLLTAIKKKLELEGFEVVTARKVEQAEQYLDDLEKVDLIWLDHYLLGKKSGLDFVAKVKTDEKWKMVPIYVISNTATPEKVQAYLSLGVNKYYTKADYRLDDIIKNIKRDINNIE